MRKGTKIALAVSAVILAGATGISSLAIADYRGSSGWGHHGRGHDSGMRHGWGNKGWGGGHAMMQRFDSNQDGKLTQVELDEARKKLLAAHDGDSDGKLTLAEFEKLWLEVKRQRMVRGFQRIDKDGDASITLDEFLKPYAKMVARMDRNNDGVLDSEDRKRHGWRKYMGGEQHRGRGDDDKDDRPNKGGGMGPRG